MDYELEILNLKKRIEELERIVLNKPININMATTGNRDKSKYMFEGKVYAKNRLVLAVIKNYVKNNDITYMELSEIFDKSLQGSLGVVELYDNAIQVVDATKRYFLKDEDIIHLSDAKVVVCTQWGIFNIVKFIKRAQALGYNIETI
jgi:hypothetical protein